MSRRDLLRFKKQLQAALGAWSVTLEYFDADVDLICVTARLDLRSVMGRQLRAHNYIPVEDIGLPDYATTQVIELFKRLCDAITEAEMQAGSASGEIAWGQLWGPISLHQTLHPSVPGYYLAWRQKMIRHIEQEERRRLVNSLLPFSQHQLSE